MTTTDVTVSVGEQDFAPPTDRHKGAGTWGLGELTELERAQQLEIVSLLKPYIECGDIVEDIEVSQKYKKKTFVGVKLNHSNVDDIISQLKSETQIRAIELINDAGELTLIELKEEGISNAVVNNLVQKGFLEKINIERDFLKAQLNPHFLFNTLNNLYGLTIKKDDMAPEMILNLSEIMSYTLYESDTDKVQLSKELTFVQNYFELEKKSLDFDVKKVTFIVTFLR